MNKQTNMKVQKDENTPYFLVQITACLCISGPENCHKVLFIFFLPLFFTTKWSMYPSTFKLTYASTSVDAKSCIIEKDTIFTHFA